jgi:hypothetical protein
MKIEFAVPFRRVLRPTASFAGPIPEPQGHPPRISRLVALAHKLDALVRSGKIADYGELARLGHICPARLTQIMVLLHLAPSIQEYLWGISWVRCRSWHRGSFRRAIVCICLDLMAMTRARLANGRRW